MKKTKILVVSDTHKMHANFEKALEREKPFDYLFHAGDVEGREFEIEYGSGCPAYIVSGNNDFYGKAPMSVEIQIGTHKVFMAHGHQFYVSMTLEHLIREARERNADIIIFGHTHVPYLEIGRDMAVMNPGSLTYPRQEGRLPSYIILEIDENGKISGEIKYIKKKIKK